MQRLRPDNFSTSHPHKAAPHSSHAGVAHASRFVRQPPSAAPQKGENPEHIRGAPLPLPLEIAFLVDHNIAQSLLQDVARHARSHGVSADIALIALGYMSEIDYYQALAAYLGVSYVDNNIRLAVECNVEEAIAAGLAPLEGGGSAMPSYIVAPGGEQLQTLLRYGRRGPQFISRIFLTAPSIFVHFLRAHGHYYIRHRASFALGEMDASLSAGTPTTLAQRFLVILALSAALACLAWGTLSRLIFSLGFSSLMIYAAILRIFAAAASRDERSIPIRPIPENQFPTYTILVPLYREASVVAQLIEHLDRLDYPRSKLDIKLLIEHDDHDTLDAIMALNLSPLYDVVRIPNGQPRTKPRALNVGLMFAKGELLVVFDAEDVPGSDQLRRAAMRFAHEPQKVACLQARLAIDNYSDSWLAATFALEYASLFDVLLPGMVELGLPIPLGGTSNHFRTNVLRQLQGWDAWNVTEDADFGLRLARFGYRVEALPSATYEEAPAAPKAWVQQRQRWLKGWMQTLLVLSRHPLRLMKELGVMPCLSTLVFLSSGVFGPLLAPLFTFLFIHDIIFSALLEPQTIIQIIASTMWCSLIIVGLVSNCLVIYMGMKRRGLMGLIAVIPALFLRQLLLSYAAWTAIFDFIRRPYYWSKTTHGLARSAHRPALRTRPSQP